MASVAAAAIEVPQPSWFSYVKWINGRDAPVPPLVAAIYSPSVVSYLSKDVDGLKAFYFEHVKDLFPDCKFRASTPTSEIEFEVPVN